MQECHFLEPEEGKLSLKNFVVWMDFMEDCPVFRPIKKTKQSLQDFLCVFFVEVLHLYISFYRAFANLHVIIISGEEVRQLKEEESHEENWKRWESTM